MKRTKRLEKGINSLTKRIEEHGIKLQEAIKKGDEELAGYYKKEIASKTEEKKKKEELLEKQ